MKLVEKLGYQNIKVMLEKCLVDATNVTTLAIDLKVSRQTIYKIIGGRPCTYAVAMRIKNYHDLQKARTKNDKKPNARKWRMVFKKTKEVDET